MQININWNWLWNTNSVRKLNCAFISKVCCDNIFCKIARSISRRTVNLCRVFAWERTTAMRGSTTIGIYDYLTTSKTGIPVRPTNDKRASWVDVKFIFRAHPAGWQNSFDKWANKFTDIILWQAFIMLCRHNNWCCCDWFPVFIFKGNLAFGVRA